MKIEIQFYETIYHNYVVDLNDYGINEKSILEAAQFMNEVQHNPVLFVKGLEKKKKKVNEIDRLQIAQLD